MSKIYAAVESATFLVAFAAIGGVNHLTWWNALLLVLCDAAYVYDSSGPFFCRVWQAFASLACLVQLTVVLMSFMGCSMIRDALRDVGPWLYYFGNFVLHYWPTLRAAAMRPSLPASTRLCYDSARILAIYSTLYRPERVYSCDMVSPYLVMPLGVGVALFLEWMVMGAALSDRGAPFSYAAYFNMLRRR